MRIHRTAIAVAVCVSILGLFAWAQGRKAGLWEVSSNMTWQQSPFPAGMAPAAMGGGPRTMQVCVTQEQLDKYGTVPPQTQRSCQVTNVVKKADGMTADMVCTGPFTGKGTIETSWTEDGHSTSKVHFTGAMQMGPNSKTIEWTQESSSVYKGTECGNVKPIVMPSDK
jgi:hypothetical protein